MIKKNSFSNFLVNNAVNFVCAPLPSIPPGKTIHAAVGRIALCMCLTCASSGLLQTIISGLVQIYKRDETFNANEIANSVLGALVAITGCCPFIEPWFAVLIGCESCPY